MLHKQYGKRIVMAPPISVLVIRALENSANIMPTFCPVSTAGDYPIPPKSNGSSLPEPNLSLPRDLPESLQQNDDCSVNEVVAAEASDIEHVRDLLEDYHPGMIAIVAKDKELGDTIHALYAAEAIAYGAVLCEKPFCNANGDGSSLQYFHRLEHCNNSGLFGLELPLAVVTGAMMQIKDLRNLLLNASNFEFFLAGA